MKPLRHRSFLRAVSIAPFFATVVLSSGTEETKTVLSSRTMDVGTHSVTIQRVVPPASDAAAAAPVASIGNRSSGSPQGSASSGAVVAGQQAGEASTASRSYGTAAALARLRNEVLSLSCTRYECGVTEVRWPSPAGGEHRILSSIDFNFLRNTGAFTEGDCSYTVFLGLGTAIVLQSSSYSYASPGLPRLGTAALPPVDAAALAGLQAPGLSRYVVLATPDKPQAEAYRGIDALHRHYDAHRDELIAQWRQMEAERLAREAEEKAHPPVPKDTVIQFWPKKNSRYLTPSAAATAGPTDAAVITEIPTIGKEAK